MDRPIIYTQEQVRGYDTSKGWQDSLKATGQQAGDILGQTITVAAGLAATQNSPAGLSILVGPGSIYQQSALDPTAAGDLPVDGTTHFLQGVSWSTQTVTLSTSALTSGQSQWALVQATFGFLDVIRTGDPSGGVLPFYNSANPSVPLQGQGGSGATLNTERTATLTLSVVYGTPATTGSQVPPSASANNVGLYLILLTYGQTTITTGQILVAGPSVGTGVPSNYPYAPFLAGLLNAHHSGNAGQAPQIDLTKEVKNILPAANLPNPIPNLPITLLYSVTGSFTATLTGFSGTAPTIRCVYTVAIPGGKVPGPNSVVTLFLPTSASGTSNSANFGLTGIPSSLIPTNETLLPAGYACIDNGVPVYSDIIINGSGGGGSAAFSKAGSASESTWTASGSKGIQTNFCVSYLI